MKAKKFLKTALLAGTFASVLTVYSCGGGGGGSSSEPTSELEVQGNAIDGYLFGSTVKVECGNNKTFESFTFDPVDKDNDNVNDYNYSVKVTNKCKGKPIYVVDGYDLGTNLSFGGALIGKVGKYHNNVTLITSLIESSSEPEKVKFKLKNFLGYDDLGVNYVEEETNANLLKFVVAMSAALHGTSQLLGQLDIEDAKKIYKEIGDRIAGNNQSGSPSAVNSFDDLINAVVDGTVEGVKKLSEQKPNLEIDNDEIIKDRLEDIVTEVVNNVDDTVKKYEDLGTPDEDNDVLDKLRRDVLSIPEDVGGAIRVGKLNISQIIIETAEGRILGLVYDGSFNITAEFTDTADNDDLIAEVQLEPENPDLIAPGEKDIEVILHVKDLDSKRSAVLKLKELKVNIDNDRTIESLDDSNMQIVVNGTDANGAPIGTLIFEGSNNLIDIAPSNKVVINIEGLLNHISNNITDENHPLKEIQLDGSRFRIGININGDILSRPVEGTLTLN